MTVLWHFYWPAIAAALVIGIVAGAIGYRRPPESDEEPLPGAKKSRLEHPIWLGFAATLLAVALWHGPLGASGRYATFVEMSARAELVHQGIPSVQARLQRGPLRRTLLLTGPADDFQRSELVRIMGEVPGASSGRWMNPPLGTSAWLPLLAEVGIFAIIPFLLGLLLSYLNELRRRSNAEWRW